MTPAPITPRGRAGNCIELPRHFHESTMYFAVVAAPFPELHPAPNPKPSTDVLGLPRGFSPLPSGPVTSTLFAGQQTRP